jgi:hypothetical protein
VLCGIGIWLTSSYEGERNPQGSLCRVLCVRLFFFLVWQLFEPGCAARWHARFGVSCYVLLLRVLWVCYAGFACARLVAVFCWVVGSAPRWCGWGAFLPLWRRREVDGWGSAALHALTCQRLGQCEALDAAHRLRVAQGSGPVSVQTPHCVPTRLLTCQ